MYCVVCLCMCVCVCMHAIRDVSPAYDVENDSTVYFSE